MFCTCDRCIFAQVKNSIAQTHQVYFYLHRILMLLEKEVYRVNKIVKCEKLCMPCRTKDVRHFLSEGQIYLNMTNILHERNQKMSKMFAIMLKAMDIYSRLKVHLRDQVFESGWKRDEEQFDEGSSTFSEEEDDDWAFENLIPVYDDFELVNFDFEEDDLCGHIDVCFYCLAEVYHRKFLLANIESLITRIKSLWVAFTGNTSALYVMLYHTLRDYCKRVRLFLHDNRGITESKRERSSRALDNRHKYDLLERLLARVSKEQENVAKYVDMTFKEESGKSSN
ncbi:PREDICTED: uncharacterized protein LOC105455717 isoform X1 [Wasmannia auropunctata]|uniref:uncharacterized protein LOC105455717 isoform X1 n=2 Tax=Wasmannia auropunctata TaxID=64793 RepID=UPI0005ED7FBA|nr:PREDICTED: uncharacterized protein LOC105455717 isoform X1 [Wasmannia auropunctata]